VAQPYALKVRGRKQWNETAQPYREWTGKKGEKQWYDDTAVGSRTKGPSDPYEGGTAMRSEVARGPALWVEKTGNDKTSGGKRRGRSSFLLVRKKLLRTREVKDAPSEESYVSKALLGRKRGKLTGGM